MLFDQTQVVMEFKLVDFQALIINYSILLIFFTLLYKNCPWDACAVFLFGTLHTSLWTNIFAFLTRHVLH